jgi:FtsH-binding integral membrane protein
LLQFADKNLSYINTKLEANNLTSRFIVSHSLVRIIIVLLPVVIVLIFSKHYRGMSRWLMQFLPAIATGVLGCLIIIPLLSESAQGSIASNPVWSLIQKYQIPVVAVGLLISIIDVVHNSHQSHSKHGHKSKE